MRLSQDQLSRIRSTIQKHFGEDVSLLLFGSRLDDQAKGGDIDLFIETDMSAEQVVEAKIDAQRELHKLLGDQKIDLVVKRKQSNVKLPIHEVAQRTGVPL